MSTETPHYPQPFLDRLNSVTAKKPRAVIQHILKHGSITSEEMQTIYGDKNPGKTIYSIRQRGIPIANSYVKSSQGKSIASYSFGDPADLDGATSPLAKRAAYNYEFRKMLVLAVRQYRKNMRNRQEPPQQ